MAHFKHIRIFACMCTFMILLTTGCSTINKSTSNFVGGGSISENTSGSYVGTIDNGMKDEVSGMNTEIIAPSYQEDYISAEEFSSEESFKQNDLPVYQKENIKLIRNASLSFETQNLNNALDKLKKVLMEYNGYIEDSQIYNGTDSYRYASYTVRVPSSDYDSFLELISESDGIGQLTWKTENTENIGDQYYDSETRLKTARIKLERLQELLKKAGKMEDIITLEDNISEVEAEIDTYSGTLKRYDGLIDYATFKIQINEVVRYTPTENTSFGYQIRETFSSSIDRIIAGVQKLVIFVAGHWFGILIFIILVMFCKKQWKKRRSVSHTNQTEKDEN